MAANIDRYAVALDVFAATPQHLSSLLEPLPATLWDWPPASREWSLSQTLTHMLDVETAVIPVRIRAMLAEDGAPMPRSASAATALTPAETLSAWRTARERNLDFLRGLTPEQLARSGIHPRYGRITAREHIIEWAYHDLDHMRQLQATVESSLYPDIGGFQALYPVPFPSEQ